MIDLKTYEGRQKFYHLAAWRNLREYFLARNPLCVECLKKDKLVPANTVDHIRRIEEWPEGALLLSNLQGMCAECHGHKSNQESPHSKEMVGKVLNTKWKVDVSSFRR